jgi:hypothetical protein
MDEMHNPAGEVSADIVKIKNVKIVAAPLTLNEEKGARTQLGKENIARVSPEAGARNQCLLGECGDCSSWTYNIVLPRRV